MVNRVPVPEELEPIETAGVDELRALQLERLKWSLKHAYDNQAPYRAKCDAAGVNPADLGSLEDLGKQMEGLSRSVLFAPR